MIRDKLVRVLDTELECVDTGFGSCRPVDVVIRPEDLIITDPSDGFFKGQITSVIFKGVHYEIEVLASGYEWLIHTTEYHEPGKEVGLRVIPFNIQIMNKPESSDEKVVDKDA